MKSSKLLLGAHTSAQGGVHQALIEGKEIGATTIQLFTANQKTWTTRPISEEEVLRWFSFLETTGISHVMSHDSYLINLGSPKEEVLEKSLHAFQEELKRCHQLKLSFLNFHPGAALDKPVEQCLDTIIKSLLSMKQLAEKGTTDLLIETTAGQGSTVGSRFEEIGYLIKGVKGSIPIGVCIDTCHLFAAGYDVSSSTGWKKTLEEFDEKIGLKYLKAIHVNDSMKGLGSKVDRHAPLGEGEIGLDGFRAMMQNQSLLSIPKYLETPGGPPAWIKEIELLRSFAS